MSSGKPSEKLSTQLVGESELTVVNSHLSYRRDAVRFPNGCLGEYTYIYDDYAAAATIPVDKRKGQRSTLLIRQERYPSQTIGWEIPAGRPAPGETSLQAAKRELREEAGITAQLWRKLPQQIESVGRGNSRSDLFIAAGILLVENSHDTEEVITDIGWFSMGEVEDLILDGELNSAHSIAGITAANAFLNRNADHTITRLVS